MIREYAYCEARCQIVVHPTARSQKRRLIRRGPGFGRFRSLNNRITLRGMNIGTHRVFRIVIWQAGHK
jgi:hypothetical protein